MCIHRLFKRQSPMASGARGVAFLFCILLIVGCGGEEAADSNPLVETVGDATFNTATPNYYPMTVGNRWVYRNPDGSEWTREITDAKIIGELLYHFSSDNPPDTARLNVLKSPAYAATPHRLVLLAKNDAIQDTVWQTIRQSGGNKQDWNLRHTLEGGTWRTQKENENALVYLFHYRTNVISHHEPTPLRFPLVPGQIFKALNMKLSGSNETASEFHSFEASGAITGEVGLPESVETPVGTFEDCLKIQYQGRLESFETMEFNSRLLMPPPPKIQESLLSLLESDIREELANLMLSITPRMGFETVWLAPGVGPVKIETPNGIAELIDYEIKGNSGE